MSSTSLAPARPGRSPLSVTIALLAAALVAWVVTVERMGGMDAGPGTELGALGWFTGAWLTMMAAMMLPSAAPAVALFARTQARREQRGLVTPTTAFVTGYLVTWTAFGLVAFAAYHAIDALAGGALAWDEGGPYAAGGAVALAGVYQLSPLKDACLRHCRSPMHFLVTRWRPGRSGALRMGTVHGAYCVGCCWGLMLVLFAVGVMSIFWMLVATAAVFAEKVLPRGPRIGRGVAVALVCLGLAIAFVPERVPGLTIPGSPEAMGAMDRMGMSERMATPGSGEGMGEPMQGRSMQRDGR